MRFWVTNASFILFNKNKGKWRERCELTDSSLHISKTLPTFWNIFNSVDDWDKYECSFRCPIQMEADAGHFHILFTSFIKDLPYCTSSKCNEQLLKMKHATDKRGRYSTPMFMTKCQSCNLLNNTADHITQINSFCILNITLTEMKEITSTRQMD